MEPLELLLLFGVGTLAGAINVTAGGGSSLTLPALIFLGLDAGSANGTNRVAIFIQNIFAVSSFRRERLSAFGTSMKMAVWTLPGSILGAIAAVRISDEWFERVLAVVLIFVIISMFFRPVKGEGTGAALLRKPKWMLYPALLGIGFYGGFIQVGVGFLIMAFLFHLAVANLVKVNMHKVFIVLIYTIPALLIFILSGNVEWVPGLGLAAGNAFGAWWAARWSVHKGDRLIRWMLVAAIVIIIARLLNII